MTLQLRLFAALVGLGIAAGGCVPGCDDSDSQRRDLELDSRDSLVDGRDPSGPPSDTSSATHRGDSADVSGMSDSDEPMGCPRWRNLAKSSYLCTDGQTRVTYGKDRDTFQMPNRTEKSGPITRLELTNKHGKLPKTARYVGVPSEYEPNDLRTELYVPSGRDVTIYFATIHPRDRYGNSKLQLTTLLNYRPTPEVVYEHYDSRRESVLATKTGISTTFPIDGAVELVDITIPANAFDGPGRYEIGFGWGVRGSIEYPAGWRRMYVFYGGCAPRPHPCMKRTESKLINDVERSIAEKYFAGGYVYPAGKYSDRSPFEDIEVVGGEKVTVNYSISAHDYKTTWAVVPIMNAKPLPHRDFVYTPPDPVKRRWYVKSRRSFQIEIPDRPGSYRIAIAMWNRPFLNHGEPTGEKLLPAGRIYGTNIITFVVPQ